jgi:hypothetical protein
MLKDLIANLKSRADDAVAFDPSSLQDPVAMLTEWTPASGGGTNFRTHKLISSEVGRIEFQASLMSKVFSLIFVIVGLGVAIPIPMSRFSSGDFALDMEIIIVFLGGAFFAILGGALFVYGTAPIVFDKQKDAFWRGRQAPDRVFDTSTIKHYAKLKDIHALQLISERCRGKNSIYYSYELNLVLKNGQRTNVVDHGDLNSLRADAASLSDFLKKPVWDAIPSNP